ncbi:uncharacterized protein TRAVEDRAFT_32074 [Trametes versicolor FP-101664 SS1]|uniref:uncharacterized protein n=1 Tax=Trametes versicolor (strain FP-101664) TaxID=717944 RepID=UPI000462416B|nr:uncharacterized protein TRAVEDRAFT_32074 [Trametes versicolor FP-101664 SS1]EIW52320.1 hypothetical protein TRAVEDRAFT_32074 [Trametes versicolor FP-101664 SS1]
MVVLRNTGRCTLLLLSTASTSTHCRLIYFQAQGGAPSLCRETDPPPTEPRPLPAPVPSTSLIPQVLERVDPDVGSSRASAAAKECVPVWLWAACTNALDTFHGSPTRPGASTRVREEAMRVLAQQFYQVYPARPNPNIPMRTIATHNFFYVLDGAPSAPDRSSQTWGTDVQGLEFVRVGDGPDGLYEWSETYLERLFTEVNGLVTRFGLGDAGGGWQTIRWLIYDRYAKCLNRGPQYDSTTKRWSDDAKFWLDEHQYEAGSEELRVSLRDRCAAGRHFNSLLPLRRPSGTVAA